jgi:phosphate transport system substrate-binding protein
LKLKQICVTFVAALTAVMVLWMLTRPAGAAGKTLVVKGSDTMANLSQAWAEAFMAKHPGTSISVSGGGSGTGIAALLNGTCDVCNASRSMSDAEIAFARKKGMLTKATTCALDGLAVAVNSSSPIKNLTLDQLAGIFSGKLTDWSQVGGHPGKILVLSRENNSGTHVFFKEHVLKNAQYAPGCLFLPSTQAIQMEISRSGAAIGYGGEAYFKNKPGVRILTVSRTKGGPVFFPTVANVISGRYPISRPLFMYTSGIPKGDAAAFIAFCLSPEGQGLVEKIGYVRVR